MNRETILIILGVLMALSPWSGFPLAWLAWFLFPAGFAVAAIAYTIHLRSLEKSRDSAPILTH